MPPDQPSSDRIIPLGELFVGFVLIGMLGFGGIAASANYVIVERNRWMTMKEFVELFGVASVLPGGNILNASVMLGDRHHGVLGAAVCLFSLLLMPLIILLIIVTTYDHFSYLPDVKAAIAGGASAVAGLIIGTGLKMARGLDRTIVAAVFGLATFLSIGIFRLPLAVVVLTIVPLSVATALYMVRRNPPGGRS